MLSNDQISLWDYPIAEIYKVIFSIQLFTEQCFLRLAICCLLFLLQPIFPRFTIGFARFCTCVPRKHLCGLLGEIFTGSRFQKLHLPLKKCDPINETSKSKQFSVQKKCCFVKQTFPSILWLCNCLQEATSKIDLRQCVTEEVLPVCLGSSTEANTMELTTVWDIRNHVTARFAIDLAYLQSIGS